MAFNFGGMMRGLGAGMVGYGEILKENDKRNWESEQARLREMRAENLAKLQMQNQKDLAGMQIDATKEEGKLTRQQQADQFGKNYTLNERELALKEENTKSANAARAQQLSISQQELGMKKKAYEDASPEAQMAQRKASADALTELGFDKKSVGAFIVTGKLPDARGSEVKVSGQDIVATQKQAGEEFDMLDEDQQKAAVRALGVKSPLEARKIYKANAVADLFVMSGQTGGTPQQPQATTERYNFSQLVQEATEGSGRAKTIAIEKITAAALSPKYKDNKEVQRAYQLIKTTNAPTEVNRDPSQFRTSGTNFSE